MPKRPPVTFEINWNACLKCGACVGVCPLPPGFTTPFDTIAVNTPCDVVCMACEKICPVSAITVHQGS
jgi:ferredoxin